jgi:hypothetical protein
MTSAQKYAGQEDLRNDNGRVEIILNSKFKSYYSKILSDK